MKPLSHVQTAPSANWVVNHNMGEKPAFDVLVDYNGVLQKVMPNSFVYSADDNTLTINFTTPLTGKISMIFMNENILSGNAVRAGTDNI